MDGTTIDPSEWDGVWYDTKYGGYFTIEFEAGKIHLIDIHEETTHATYSNGTAFLDDAETFHRLDPQTVLNPEHVIEEILADMTFPDAHDNIALQYALDVTEITKRDSATVDRDRVEDAVVAALDAAYDAVPPDGRLPREKAKDVVSDAIDHV